MLDTDAGFAGSTREEGPETPPHSSPTSRMDKLNALLRSEKDSLLEFTARHMHLGLRRREEPEDILQRASLSALKKIQGLEADAEILPWFKGVVLRTILCLDRDERRLKRNPEGAVVHLDDYCEGLHRIIWSIGVASGSSSPEEEASFHEDCERLLDALDAIPPIQTGLIVLVIVRGMKIGEAARELHL